MDISTSSIYLMKTHTKDKYGIWLLLSGFFISVFFYYSTTIDKILSDNLFKFTDAEEARKQAMLGIIDLK